MSAYRVEWLGAEVSCLSRAMGELQPMKRRGDDADQGHLEDRTV
jgi:hypothetical protein